MTEIQSLARGLRILEMLAESDDGRGITDLANEMGIDKGSVSRLLQTLAHYGFADKDLDTKRYHLGPMVVSLSRSLLVKMPLRETAKPYLHKLVDLTGECAHLGVYAQERILYVDQEESPFTLRVNAEVGSTAPLHCTALGKAVLAFGGAPFPKTLSLHTTRTIIDPDLLHYNLELTKKQGYAIDDEEFDYGVRCIAAPVHDFRGKTIGAIGISGPAARITLEKIPEIAKSVMEVARELTEKMSFKKKSRH